MPAPPAMPPLAALAARYGAAAAAPAAAAWNDTIALLLAHRSVRGYRPDPPPPGTLEALVAAAQSAATSSNLQAWSVVSVTDPATRAALARIANGQAHIEECPIFLVWIADLSRHARLAEAEGAALEGLPYLETFLVAVIDAALAAQNAVIAAESLGLSTVYIGALRNRPEEVAALLGLPRGAMAVFGLCVGYAREGAEGEVKPRLPQAAVLHHGRYGTEGEAALRAGYDRALAAFSARQEMAQAGWTGRVLARLGRLRALSGRDRMREALAALGFPLR
ncbi:NADPH-dependent oxidoreductase [Crenalkalicoccus roseus]|uniref:NADPH-dependent oxidoreductase n=1 Tax=Crenalkalicoccus roseus TaxID=1485588 RepID=UPI0010806E9C|nr:NADPH-dependent oxidoreductase [Crenalkalicoccus roseus]